MPISIFKVFMIFGIVSSWAAKALADGKITLLEAVELATLIAGVLGVTLAIDVPAPTETVLETTDADKLSPDAHIEDEPVKARPPDN